MQAPYGIILIIGLLTFIPESPRYLMRKGDAEGARNAFMRIRDDLQSEEAQVEFQLMRAQIEYEQQREVKSFKELFKLYRHRFLWCNSLLAIQIHPC